MPTGNVTLKPKGMQNLTCRLAAAIQESKAIASMTMAIQS